MMINAEMSTLFEVSRHTATSAQPLLPTRGTLLGSHGGCGLIAHIVNVNECIDINIAVLIQIYECAVLKEKSDIVTILESNSSSILHMKPTSVQIVHI